MIEENKVVILRKNDVYKAIKLVRGKKVTFERTSFLPDVAFGRPFGSTYNISRQGILVPIQDEEGGGVLLTATESSEDNRKIIDDGTAQTLSHDDIHEMKKQGVSGQMIMESVVQGSTSFKDRTKYSQEKYVKKKVKRHKQTLSILQCSTRLLCHLYYAKGPTKICHLRMDTLGQMLTLGNVHAHSNIVVMETCQGLLTGAILERIGGYGNVVQIYYGDRPVRTALDSFGHLTDKDMSSLLQYPLHQIKPLLQHGVMESLLIKESIPLIDAVTEDGQKKEREGKGDDEEEEGMEGQEVEQEVKDVEQEVNVKEQEVEEEGEGKEDSLPLAKRRRIDDSAIDEEKEKRKKAWEEKLIKAGTLLMKKQMDGLLIACRFHPQVIVESLLQFVSPSRPVIIYSQFHEPLVQCYQFLKETGKVFNLQLTETWWRNYQVLSNRTHPSVNMDGQSGYLLYGTTIIN